MYLINPVQLQDNLLWGCIPPANKRALFFNPCARAADSVYCDIFFNTVTFRENTHLIFIGMGWERWEFENEFLAQK